MISTKTDRRLRAVALTVLRSNSFKDFLWALATLAIMALCIALGALDAWRTSR